MTATVNEGAKIMKDGVFLAPGATLELSAEQYEVMKDLVTLGHDEMEAKRKTEAEAARARAEDEAKKVADAAKQKPQGR